MTYQKHKSEESVEDYLETILLLSKKLPNVRSIDIANEMGYSKPSVSVAMKNLKQHNYISVLEDGYIRLTKEGRALAESVYERHSLLSEWLISLGVAPETAVADACKMEHDISSESFEAIKRCVDKLLKS
ncbi:MAG: metal-dependent transcriptional regulator [Lachnospiraceae bacterium]|nr:metal-dependent transcriptional regulator [Lachnospiraceae bacterium]